MSKARTAAHTGFIADWLPPVGHERPSRALLDPSLLETDVLYTPGGDPGLMVVLHSSDLLRATSATVAPLGAESEPEPSGTAARAAG